MDIRATLPADEEAAQASQPGEGTLNDPAMLAQALAGVDAAASHARFDATSATCSAAKGIVISLVGVEFGGPFAWSSRAA